MKLGSLAEVRRPRPRFGLVGAASSSLEGQLTSFFAFGVKGAWYERSNTASLFQDSTGISSVTAPGQMLGLGLSRDQGGGRGAQLVSSPNVTGVAIGGPSLTTYTVGSGMVAGRFYEISATVSGYGGSGDLGFSVASFPAAQGGSRLQSNGIMRAILPASGTSIILFSRAGNTANFSSVSVAEVPGNHQIQATAGLLPIYQTTPKRLVFDGIDDALSTTFPASLGSNCTVGRAIPGTGAVISSGVTIGTTFSDSVTSCALLIADRSLSASELALWTSYLNQQSTS